MDKPPMSNRNYVKKHMDAVCKPKTEPDKSKYSRKEKHKEKY